jgi:predicted phage tail protein
MKFKMFTFVLSMAALSSCELLKEDTTAPDGSVPYIVVRSPDNNGVYTRQQQVRVKFEITDKDKIQQLEVHVTKEDGANGDVWGFTSYPKKNPVVLDTTFSATGLATGKYSITLNTIDGRTNVGTKVIQFSIK